MDRRAKEPKRTPCDYDDISSICYSVLSENQLLNFSVLEITEDNFYDNDIPAKGGLFDLRLGVSGPGQICQTCGESTQCPGHFGHIKLQEPVLHYGFLHTIADVLKCICHNCKRIKRCKDPSIKNKMKQIKKLSDPSKRLKLMVKLLQNISKCNSPYQEQDIFDKNYKSCGASSIPTNIHVKNYKITYVQKPKKTCVFDRREIRMLLQGISIYSMQCQALGFTKTKPIDLLIQSIAVPPPQVRPYVLIKSQQKCEDDMSIAYLKILRRNMEIKKSQCFVTQKAEKVQQIEKLIASIMIKIKNVRENVPKKAKKSNKKIKSISQRLRGKQGRFRDNLLGKRVDFSARSVISPDPNLELDQLGMPEKIARNLTYPQKVTALNFERIVGLCLERKVKILIIPPSQILQNEQKAINVSKIQAVTHQQMRKYVSYGMIAQRTIQDGDYVLLNRQPTLHRMSMMAHRVRVLPYNTFRINLAVCSPYNADFDGDQMNVHVPQSLQSLSELKNISAVQNQIVGPKNGSTSMGFSQDSLLGAWLLTSKDTFLAKQQIMNLLVWLTGDQMSTFEIIEKLPVPAIIKPEQLWTGKQIISLLLPKQLSISVKKGKNNQKVMQNAYDSTILIKQGQIITGNLQKQQIGASSSLNNIIHYIWMQKGPQYARIFINNLQKIVYNWLTSVGFSLGASDIVPEPELLKKKQKQSKQVSDLYYKIFNSYRDKQQISGKHLHQQGKKIMNSFQYNVNLQLNNRLSKVQQIVKAVQNSYNNNIYKIIQAKSKGSQTNLAQIIYSVGNQNINGQRCPLGFTRRALPHFRKDDNSPAARGYVVSSFYEGLKPEQLFFHSMGGRQGLSDTAIKTSHVGYIQRKIVKSLEDIMVKYDSSVRDSKNNILQNYYGEDGFLAQFIEKHVCKGASSSKNKFRQLYKWKDDQLKRTYRYTAKQTKQLKKEYSLLYRNRKIFKQIFCANVDSPTYEYFCPIAIQRIINKIKLSSKHVGSDKKNNSQNRKVKPCVVYQAVQKLIQECILPPQKYLRQSKKIDKLTENDNQKQDQDKDWYQSFSDEFQRQDENKQQIFFKKYNEPQKVRENTAFDIFKLHLRFGLSSKVICKTHNLTKQNFDLLIQQIKQKFFKSLAPAGEAVGCIASQSIGQPTTQMTLNTFHLAGVSDRNVTLGLPRIDELLNCKLNSQNTKIIIFPLRPILYKQRNSQKNQSHLLEMLTYHLPYRKIQDFISSVHCCYNPTLLTQKQKQSYKLGSDKKRTAWMIQFVFNRHKIRSQQIWENIISSIQKLCHITFEIDDVVEYKSFSILQQNPKIVLRYICSIEDYQQDKQGKQLNHRSQYKRVNTLFAIQSLIKQTPICGIKGLSSVKIAKRNLNILGQDEQKPEQYVMFQATGNSLNECLQHPLVNKTKTYSNNIQQISKVLGIQAARQALINQFKQVLKPYGIVINYRHFSVLADWMCCQGSLTEVNRNGFKKLKGISTLTKASFQQATPILFNAAVFSAKNEIKDTTQRIIFGQPTQCGTSQCQLMIDSEKSKQYICRLPQNKLINQQNINVNLQDKTPILEYSLTYDNSYSDLNNSFTSYRLGYNGKSPGHVSASPLLSFSPTYSSMVTNIRNTPLSPRHPSQMKFEGGKTDLTSRSNSPMSSPHNYRSIRSPSPTYNMIGLHKNISPTNVNHLPSVGEDQNKEEQGEDQSNTRLVSRCEDQF